MEKLGIAILISTVWGVCLALFLDRYQSKKLISLLKQKTKLLETKNNISVEILDGRERLKRDFENCINRMWETVIEKPTYEQFNTIYRCTVGLLTAEGQEGIVLRQS